MTEPRTVGAGALVVAGAAALSLLGPAAAFGAVGVALALLLGGRVPGGRWAGGVWAVGALAAAAWGGDRAEVLATLLSAMTMHRVGSRALAADRVPVLLSALSLLVAAARRDDPWIAGPVAVHLLATPLALCSARARWTTAVGLGAATWALGAAAFLLAPRVVPPSRDERTGFAEHVELGAMDRLLDDRTVVFRARVMPDAVGELAWRGTALDEFDGGGWRARELRTPVEVTGPRLLPEDASVVEVVSVAPATVLFTTGQVVDLRAEGAELWTDGRGGFRADGARRWRLVSLPPQGVGARVAWDDTAGDLGAATRLPDDLDPRIRELARAVAGEGTPLERVEALRQHLRREYRYTRTPRARGDEQPLATFLFESRAGHCEYFATALAVLARAADVPSRVVNGYSGGELGADGWMVVRESDAHAWVEVWVEGAWRAVDATPASVAEASAPAWSPPLRVQLGGWWEAAVGYGRDEQLGALWSAAQRLDPGAGRTPWRGLAVLAGVGAAIAAASAWAARRTVPRLLDPPSPPLGAVAAAHQRARRALAERGIRPPVGLPPVAAAEWAVEVAPSPATEALHELAWLVYEVELGGAAGADAAVRARELESRARSA